MNDEVRTTAPTGTAPKSRDLNEMRQLNPGPGAPSRVIPEDVAKHYTQDGNAFRSAYRPDKIEFVDRGSRMHAYFPITTFTTRAMAETAQARGWKEVELTGTKEFKQTAYIEAASRGIQVRGYEPTEKDAEILQRREDRKAAADHPAVKAFIEASTEKAKKAAIAEHPQLKAAFAVDVEAKKFAAANIDSKKASQAFVDRTRDNISLQIYRGQEITLTKAPDKAPAAQQEAKQDHKQDQGRSR